MGALFNNYKNMGFKIQNHRKPLNNMKSQAELLLMISPAFIAALLFYYLPMYGITFAFRDLSFSEGIWLSPFSNPWYQHLEFLTRPDFWHVMRNTVLIAFSKFIFAFPAPIILALLINEVRIPWYKRTVQSISYLPYFISWVIISGLINTLFSIDNGPIAMILKAINIDLPDIFSSSKQFIPLLVITELLKNTGWSSIIYLAAITGIDVSLYDASKVDGAGKLKQIIHVTLPGIAPAITIMLILSIPNLVRAGFDQVYNMQNPMVMDVADIVDTYVLRLGLREGRYSLATAIGLFNSVISCALVLFSNTLSKKFGGTTIFK